MTCVITACQTFTVLATNVCLAWALSGQDWEKGCREGTLGKGMREGTVRKEMQGGD